MINRETPGEPALGQLLSERATCVYPTGCLNLDKLGCQDLMHASLGLRVYSGPTEGLLEIRAIQILLITAQGYPLCWCQ